MDVEFWTSLDGYRTEQWPTSLTCRPEKGDRVESRNGRQLKIAGITHCQRYLPGSTEPYLRIELHH